MTMPLLSHLRDAEKKCAASGVDNPSLDARLLFCHALGIDRAQLLSQSKRILTAHEIQKIDALIARREKRQPVARIIGKREFWGLDFGLNDATLEPRPDSETLIEAVLSSFSDSGSEIKILDLGTGTGCLILSLLHELPNATGIGVDISPQATEQATQNAAALRLNTRAEFRVGNWFEGAIGKFDIIISNPPYIPASDIPNLMQEVRGFDPARALDGGADGLDPYRIIIPQLPHFLKPNGIACVEFGQGQAPAVTDLFKANGFSEMTTYKDLGGIERCIAASI